MHLIYYSWFGVLFLLSSQLLAQPCVSDYYLQHAMDTRPELLKIRQNIEYKLQSWIQNNAGQLDQRNDVITLPVVMHIVQQEGVPEISEAQIQSQMDALNEDFRLNNDNLNIVPPEFESVLADIELEFCLAQEDPSGNPTSGIIRSTTFLPFIGDDLTEGRRSICYAEFGGSDAWDTERYINIWVGERLLGGGEASFPGQEEFPEEDGIRIDPDVFGRIGPFENPNNDQGKTLTHEMGHYFNLIHVWGFGFDPTCSSDDEVDDTPDSDRTYIGECPDSPIFSCGSLDMYMNYMTFANDACLAMFTQGQKARMLATLNTVRAGLLESSFCLPPSNTNNITLPNLKIGPNPSYGFLELTLDSLPPDPISLTLFNIQGQHLARTSWPNQLSWTWDLNNLPSGTYFLQLKTSRWELSQKVVLIL